MNRSAKQNDLELEKQQKKNELKLKVNTHNVSSLIFLKSLKQNQVLVSNLNSNLKVSFLKDFETPNNNLPF